MIFLTRKGKNLPWSAHCIRCLYFFVVFLEFVLRVKLDTMILMHIFSFCLYSSSVKWLSDWKIAMDFVTRSLLAVRSWCLLRTVRYLRLFNLHEEIFIILAKSLNRIGHCKSNLECLLVLKSTLNTLFTDILKQIHGPSNS